MIFALPCLKAAPGLQACRYLVTRSERFAFLAFSAYAIPVSHPSKANFLIMRVEALQILKDASHGCIVNLGLFSGVFSVSASNRDLLDFLTAFTACEV